VVKAIVLDVDQDKERISLGIKQLGSSPAKARLPVVSARAQR
jgi:ribosomal protein S1